MDEIPVMFSARRADEADTSAKVRVKILKREIENNRYDVDAPAVADAILRKIRLLKQGGGDPGQRSWSNPAGSRGPPGPLSVTSPAAVTSPITVRVEPAAATASPASPARSLGSVTSSS